MNDSTDNALKPNTILHGNSYTYTIEKKLGEFPNNLTKMGNRNRAPASATGQEATRQ